MQDLNSAAGRQRLLDAWRELWGLYQAIVDGFDGLIYICSPNYEIEFINQHLAELLGCRPLGEKCHRAFYRLDHPCPWCSKDRVQRGETVRRQAADPGSGGRYHVVANPLYAKGEVLTMVTTQLLGGLRMAPERFLEAPRFFQDLSVQNVA